MIRLIMALASVLAASAVAALPEAARPHPGSGASASSVNIHDIGGQPRCTSCHRNTVRAAKVDAVATCARCHPRASDHHTVRAPVPSEVVVSLPLGEGRKVVCHTCHDPHKVVLEQLALRAPRERLCRLCHAARKLPRAVDPPPAAAGPRRR